MKAYDGVFSQSFKYPPYSTDELLQQKGWQAVDDMLTMSACRAPFNLKRYAMLEDGWTVDPAVTDPYDPRAQEAKTYSDHIRWVLGNIKTDFDVRQDFRSYLFDMFRANWDGFRVAEIGYRYLEDGPYAGMLGLDGMYTKKAKQIGFDVDTATLQVRHITSYTPGAGGSLGPAVAGGGYDFLVPPDRCVIYTFAIDGNDPHGNGDWRGCYKHYWSLDNINRFWVKSLERWGSPVLIGNAPTNGLDKGIEVLDNIRNGGSALLPENVKVQIAQVAAGVFDGYRLAAMWHEQQISKNIQCNTLSSSEGSRVGSLSLGEVHQDSGETVYGYGKADMAFAIAQQLINRLLKMNYAGYDETLCPVLSLGGDDAADVLPLMQAYDLAIKDGVVSKRAKFIRPSLGWAPMDPDEEKMLDQEAQAQQEAQQQIADSRNSNKIGVLDTVEQTRALDILTRAISARIREEAAAA